MANWKTTKPITTELKVLVVGVDGREGWANVAWNSQKPKLFGPVFDEIRYFDDNGIEIQEPTKTVIDSCPTFNG